MGRRKASPVGGELNPLQRMFGTFLRLERGKLGYSSADVARRLGLTDTYFRLAESGRAALNQAMVFKIIAVFGGASAVAHQTQAMSFHRLAQYMVGTHWVGAEMAASGIHEAADHKALENLASLVADFQLFYEKTQAFFDFDEGSIEQRVFLEEVAAPEVGDFLRSDNYANAADIDRDLMELKDLPTLNIDILLALKQSLSGRSFVHTADIAANWEVEREQQFRFERGLYKSADIIVNENNLQLFHYAHLRRKRFEGVQMIFRASNEDEEALKNRFIRLLNDGRRRVDGLNSLTSDEVAKIHFICLSPLENKTFSVACDRLLSRDSQKHDAYWAFETHLGLQIAFIGVLYGNAENTRNLSLRDASHKIDEFVKLWTEINVNRSNASKRLSVSKTAAAHNAQSLHRSKPRKQNSQIRQTPS